MSIPDVSRYPDHVITAARAAIDATKAAGDISGHGYGEPIPGERGMYRTGIRVTNPYFDLLEVATSLLYLIGGPVKALRNIPQYASSSYGWKHKAENWGEGMGFAPYVANGAFIVAAEWLQVPSRRREGSPNIVYALKQTRDLDDSLVMRWNWGNRELGARQWLQL